MDPDKEAKERAKRPVAAATASSQRSAHSEAARLDGRIAEKRKVYNGAADDEAAKNRGRRPDTSNVGVKRDPVSIGSSGRQELGMMETDAAAKARAKSTQATGPGAYTVSAGQTELSAIERDADAKARAAVGRTELSRMEQDAAAKARARPVHGAPPALSLPTGLNQMEDDIVAKSRARPPSDSFVTPGARAALDHMEEVVIAKAGVSTTAPTGAQLGELEQDIVTKHNTRYASAHDPIPATHDDLRRLEERIAQKTGTVFVGREDDIPEHRPMDVNPAEDNEVGQEVATSLSKLNGVPADALASALNTGKLDVSTNNGIYALERSLDKHGRQRDGGELGDVGYVDEEADRLAVAVAVRDGDDEAHIPAAVEFDPDAKPPIYKNRRCRLYGLLGCVVLLVLGAGLVFGLSILGGDDGDMVPTESPTLYRESIGIQAQIELLVGTEKLADPSTPHYRAMQWIILEDPRQLTADDPLLVQRYLHVLFYFSTTRDRPWLSCNPPVESEDNLCLWQQLIAVFPHEYRGVPTTRWLTGDHECQWAGVFCDEFNQTRGLAVSAQNMTGTLPVEVALFPFLQSVDLSWNSFTGTLPEVYGTMKHLLNFELHYNFLTGTIPDSWWDFLNLQRVNWAGNQLTGTLPARIAEMRDVKGFFIYDNFLTGQLPTEIGSLDLLTYARLQRNFFTGSLPSELGKLEELRELWMHRLDIKGSIPREIGNFKNMFDMRFHFTSLEGEIPDSLWSLHDLRRLDLYDTKLSGTISTEIGKISNLSTLRLRESQFYGTIPTELGLLTGLDEVWLHGNNFTGSIPDELCELRGPYTLEVITADCLGDPDPAVSCRFGCCTLCCDQVTDECSS